MRAAGLTDASGCLATPPRPRFAFRVGVTGSRSIEASSLNRIRQEVRIVLTRVADVVAALSELRGVKDLYQTDRGERIGGRLSVISPLADGADRIVADIATELGYRLDVVLPFARAEYTKDFDDESRLAFDRYFAPADGRDPRPYLALDGGRGDDEARSYEAVGRLLVRNCDLLIAIWDGRPVKGRGGTADIVRFATTLGLPVWWIDAYGNEAPRLIRSTADLRARETVPRGEQAELELIDLTRKMLAPPAFEGAHPRGVLSSLVRYLHIAPRLAVDPLHVYLHETPLPHRIVWRTHSLLLQLLSGSSQRPAVENKTLGYWAEQYEPADQSSVDYRDRYRSSYVLVFGLAMFAVLFAIVAIAIPGLKPHATGLELLCLGLIVLLVGMNQRRGWQRRWIDYRLLAELCRKQEMLSLLGWSLPLSNLRQVSAHVPAAPWVGWYFNALMRAAPLANGNLHGEKLQNIKNMVSAKLLDGQAEYHLSRSRMSAQAGRRLATWGELAFLTTCVVVAAKFAFIFVRGAHELVVWLGVIAAVLPALSAALVGVRAYSELELLEQQSARLAAIMSDADRRINTLRLDLPLASQDLAAELFDVSSTMMQDVSGWAELFHLKVVEAG